EKDWSTGLVTWPFLVAISDGHDGTPRRVQIQATFDGRWTIDWTVMEQQGRPVIASMQINPPGDDFAAVPSAGLIWRSLLRLRASDLLDAPRPVLRDEGAEVEWDPDNYYARASAELEPVVRRRPLERRPGRRRRNDADLAAIAADYVAAVRHGSRRP